MTFNVLNIGFAGSFSSNYIERPFTANEANEDIFYFLGTEFGTTSWSNPNGNGQLTVTVHAGSTSGSPTVLTDLVDVSSVAGNAVTWGLQFEFNNCVVSPTDIYIERTFGSSSDNNDVIDQVWEGSNNGTDWEVIGSNNIIDAGDISQQWENINPNIDTGFFKFLRFTFTTGGLTGSIGLNIREMELYGALKTLDGTSVSRISPPTSIGNFPDLDLDSPQDGDYLYWDNGRILHRREKLYRTSRQVLSTDIAPSGGLNNQEPNFYVLDPGGASRNFDLPANPITGLFYRVRNLDTVFEINIREAAVTVATIGGAGGAGLTQADMWYDGTEWSIITG